MPPKSARRARARRRVERLFQAVRVERFDSLVAAAAGMVREQLERRGTRLGPYDNLIASHAVALGLRLLTHNLAEFRRVEGLGCASWRTS